MNTSPIFTILAITAILFALLIGFTISMQLALWMFIGVIGFGLALLAWRWKNL